MKFEINERGSRQFYDEIVYVSARRNEIEKTRKLKLNGFNKYYRGYIILGCVSTVMMIVFYFLFNMNIFLIFAGMMLFASIFIIMNYFKLNKYIDNMMSETDTKIIEIDENGLVYKDGVKELNYKWDEMLGIVVGKHSVSFLPKQLNEYAVAMEIKYKDDILKIINDNGLQNLLINTN